MTKIVPFFVLLVVACSTPKTSVLKTSFDTLYQSTTNGAEVPGSLHITNNEDFMQLIETLNIDATEFNSFATVDFKENDVVVLYQGQKKSGGFSIEITSVSWDDEVLLIKKLEKSPGKGEMVTLALTAPYCIVQIPKAPKIKIIE